MNNMESPFAKHHANSSIVLYLEPILNTYYQTYQNVITLSDIPSGPLADLTTTISTPKLSPFQQAPMFSNSRNGSNCIIVLLRYPKEAMGGRPSLKNLDYFMTADDIPSVFSYLQSNGYIIDTDLTKMLYKSRVTIGGVSDTRISGDRKMICMFRRENAI